MIFRLVKATKIDFSRVTAIIFKSRQDFNKFTEDKQGGKQKPRLPCLKLIGGKLQFRDYFLHILPT